MGNAWSHAWATTAIFGAVCRLPRANFDQSFGPPWRSNAPRRRASEPEGGGRGIAKPSAAEDEEGCFGRAGTPNHLRPEGCSEPCDRRLLTRFPSRRANPVAYPTQRVGRLRSNAGARHGRAVSRMAGCFFELCFWGVQIGDVRGAL